MPRVSVVIPTYNRAWLVGRAAFSALDQTFADLEVIVVDDCSDDATSEVIAWLLARPETRGRLRYLRASRRGGANVARNIGIGMARGEYIAFLDSDDVWRRDKIAVQFRRIGQEAPLNAGNQPYFCFSGRYRVDDAGGIIARQFAGSMRDAPRKIRSVNSIGTLSSVLMTGWVARHAGGFNEALKACQDWDFFARVIPFCRVVGSPEPLVMYVDGQIDRISRNHRERLKAHLWMRAAHMRDLSERELAEFYRNVAEDLEGLGKTSLARRFLSRSKWLGGSYLEAVRVGVGTGSLGVREARYAGYRKRARTGGGESLDGFARALAMGKELAARWGGDRGALSIAEHASQKGEGVGVSTGLVAEVQA